MRAGPAGPADRAESTIDGADQSLVPDWAGDDALTETRSDAELIADVRAGDQQAFAALYERHASAARAVARRYSNSAVDAEDAVADGFARILAAVRAGNGPDAAFRAYLFTVVRRVALHRVEHGRKVEPTSDVAALEAGVVAVESSDEPTMAGFERDVVAQAYRSLPERWQAVLWYTEVEGLTPAQIAPALGIPANAVAVLAYRAREGLRQAYLQQHVVVPAGDACARITPKLGAYVRGSAAARDTAAVTAHLDECPACRGLVLELGEVSHAMRAVIGPLVLGTAALTAVQGLGLGGAAAWGGSTVAAGATAAAAGAAAAGSVSTGLAAGATAGSAVGTGVAGAPWGAGVPVGLGTAAPVGAGVAAPVGAAAPAAAVPGGTSAAVGAAGAGTSVAAAGGAAGGSAAGWGSLAAGASAGAFKLGATGALVAAAVGVVPALGPILPEAVGQDLSVLSLLAPTTSEDPLPGQAAPGSAPADGGPADSGRPGTDPAAVVLPQIVADGSGVEAPAGPPGIATSSDDVAATSNGVAPADVVTGGPGRGNADGPKASSAGTSGGPGSAGGTPARGGASPGAGAPGVEAPRGNGPPGGDGPPGKVATDGGTPRGHGPNGDGPPGHVGGVGSTGGNGVAGTGSIGNGSTGNGAPGHGPNGDGPPGQSVSMDVPGAVDVPRGRGPNGEGPPGHAIIDAPAAAEVPRAVSVPRGKGPNGEGPPGHQAP